MGEVEGGTASFMQLMRHETGHALDSAYRLHERADWRAVFGRSTRRTTATTGRSPTASASCAIWTTATRRATRPRTSPRRWRCGSTRSRAGARATAAGRRSTSCATSNRLMREIAGAGAAVRLREQVEPLSSVTLTLGAYYERKAPPLPRQSALAYERDLKRLFRERKPGARRTARRRGTCSAARPAIRKLVAGSTGAFQYDIDRVLREMIERSADLDLVVRDRRSAGHGAPRVRRGTARALPRAGASPARAMRKKRRSPGPDARGVGPARQPARPDPEGHRRVPHRARRDRRARRARPRSAQARRRQRPRPDPAGVHRARARHRVQPAGRLRRRRHLRPARRRLPRAAAQALHRLQPARHDARARQGRCRRSCWRIHRIRVPRFVVFPVGQEGAQARRSCPTRWWSSRSTRKPRSASRRRRS